VPQAAAEEVTAMNMALVLPYEVLERAVRRITNWMYRVVILVLVVIVTMYVAQ
jgi:hypothetical protein